MTLILDETVRVSTSRLRKAGELYVFLKPDEPGGHTYVVHIATLHCGRYMRWLIFVDTHLYKGFCGYGASGGKEQAG